MRSECKVVTERAGALKQPFTIIDGGVRDTKNPRTEARGFF